MILSKTSQTVSRHICLKAMTGAKTPSIFHYD